MKSCSEESEEVFAIISLPLFFFSFSLFPASLKLKPKSKVSWKSLLAKPLLQLHQMALTVKTHYATRDRTLNTISHVW